MFKLWPVIFNLLKKTRSKGKFLLPILSPSQILQFMNGMRLRMGNGISLVSLLFEGWSMTVEEHHNQLSMVKSNIETSSLSDCLVLNGDNSCVMM